MPASVAPRIAVPSSIITTPVSLANTGVFFTPASGMKTRVVGLWLIPNAAVVLTFSMGAVALTGAMTIPTTGIYLPPVPVSGIGAADFMSLWGGAVDEAFGATFGSAVQVSGCVWTIEERP